MNPFKFYGLETYPSFASDRHLGRKPVTSFGGELSESKCLDPRNQSGVDTLLPLSGAYRFYALRYKPKFTYGRKLRS